MLFHQKLYGRTGTGAILDFVEEYQRFAFDKRAVSHCRKVHDDSVGVQIPVKSLLRALTLDKVNFYEVSIVMVCKLADCGSFPHLSGTIKKRCFGPISLIPSFKTVENLSIQHITDICSDANLQLFAGDFNTFLQLFARD